MRDSSRQGPFFAGIEPTIPFAFFLLAQHAVLLHIAAQRNLVRRKTNFAQYTVNSSSCISWKPRHAISEPQRAAQLRVAVDHNICCSKYALPQLSLNTFHKSHSIAIQNIFRAPHMSTVEVLYCLPIPTLLGSWSKSAVDRSESMQFSAISSPVIAQPLSSHITLNVRSATLDMARQQEASQ